jgi:hypothetical protein
MIAKKGKDDLAHPAVVVDEDARNLRAGGTDADHRYGGETVAKGGEPLRGNRVAEGSPAYHDPVEKGGVE